ncbi:hypothetical protein WJ977_21270 [Achromobacter xylosoxidans]
MPVRRVLLLLVACLVAKQVQADELGAFYRRSVYETAPDLKSCQEFARGVPRRMGDTADTREGAKVFLGGRGLVVTAHENGSIRSHYFYLRKEDCERLELRIVPPAERIDPVEYIASLKSRYDSRLHFQSARAEQVIRAYRIDCPRQEGRYIPLINLLYSSMSTIDRPDAWLELIVEDRDGQIRVLNDFRGSKVPAGANTGPDRVGVQIDESGNMKPLRKASIIDDACFGTLGPIWRDE